MNIGIRETLRRLFRGSEDAGGESDGDGEKGRFVPSPLDRSVRAGHGGSSDERARELADVNQQARKLEAERRGN